MATQKKDEKAATKELKGNNEGKASLKMEENKEGASLDQEKLALMIAKEMVQLRLDEEKMIFDRLWKKEGKQEEK